MTTCRERRIIYRTLRLLNQFDREHLSKENDEVLDSLYEYLESEKEYED